jgi:hypothetical protein
VAALIFLNYKFLLRSDRFIYSFHLQENNSSKGKIDSIREEEPLDDASSSLGFSEPSTTSEYSNPPMPDELLDNSLTYSSLGTSDEKDQSLHEPSNMPESKTKQSQYRVDPLRKFSTAPITSTCVHKNGCGTNFLHPPKSFRSLHSLHFTEVSGYKLTDLTI